jgi:hypothetical protein
MASFWISVALNAVKIIIGSGVFQRLVAEITRLNTIEMPGSEKRDALLAFAKAELANVSEKLIRAALELYLLSKENK